MAVVDESLPVSLLDCKVLGCRVEFALRCTKPDKLKTRKEKLLLDFRKRTMSSVQIQNGTGLEQQVNFWNCSSKSVPSLSFLLALRNFVAILVACNRRCNDFCRPVNFASSLTCESVKYFWLCNLNFFLILIFTFSLLLWTWSKEDLTYHQVVEG